MRLHSPEAHRLSGLSSSKRALPPPRFASAARRRIRLDGGGYRCDHLRALARRVRWPMPKSEIPARSAFIVLF
jgi:hypothetical protein